MRSNIYYRLQFYFLSQLGAGEYYMKISSVFVCRADQIK